ncbi:hypothetical protein [Alteromonas sp. ASW11-130]|nr:hypothetical protein [Alteromonas sp. ASW11-130]MCW8091505.1 hypothetical protein [Alteromonas sp. ASW11-130]
MVRRDVRDEEKAIVNADVVAKEGGASVRVTIDSIENLSTEVSSAVASI